MKWASKSWSVVWLLVWLSAWTSTEGGISYVNQSKSPISLGIVTVFDARHLYEDCWYTLQANGGKVRVGEGAFSGRLYWVVVKRNGRALQFGGNGNAASSVAYLHNGPTNGEIWDDLDFRAVPYEGVARQMWYDKKWDRFLRECQGSAGLGKLTKRQGMPQPYPALLIAGSGQGATLTIYDDRWTLNSVSGRLALMHSSEERGEPCFGSMPSSTQQAARDEAEDVAILSRKRAWNPWKRQYNA